MKWSKVWQRTSRAMSSTNTSAAQQLVYFLTQNPEKTDRSVRRERGVFETSSIVTDADNRAVVSFVETGSEDLERTDRQIADRAQDRPLNRLRAVVSYVGDVSLTLACQLPNDRVEISLPVDLIPGSLAEYGKPVWVKLDTSSGYKRPVIEEREIDRGMETDAEIEAWLISE